MVGPQLVGRVRCVADGQRPGYRNPIGACDTNEERWATDRALRAAGSPVDKMYAGVLPIEGSLLSVAVGSPICARALQGRHYGRRPHLLPREDRRADQYLQSSCGIHWRARVFEFVPCRRTSLRLARWREDLIQTDRQRYLVVRRTGSGVREVGPSRGLVGR